MNFEDNKVKVVLIVFCTLLAFIVLLDFVIPGVSHTEKVKSVEKNRQQYYNAARNHHHSYQVKTDNIVSDVSEKFAKKIKEGDTIKLEVSLFFKEINSYEKLKTLEKETYSLRIFSGLAIPLFIFLIMFFGFKRKVGNTLLFVSGILMVANFIYVLF